MIIKFFASITDDNKSVDCCEFGSEKEKTKVAKPLPHINVCLWASVLMQELPV